MTEDLDHLADELDAERVDGPAEGAGLESWLELVASRGASDLLLLAGETPALRVQGRIVRTAGDRIAGPPESADARAARLPRARAL